MDPHDPLEHPADWARLDQYVSGRGTPDELEELRRWVESDPERRALAETMATVGRPVGAAPVDWDARASWQRLHRQMRRAERAPLKLAGLAEPAARGWRRVASWSVAAAATIVLAAGATFALVNGGLTSSPDAVAPVPMREVVTRRGERAVLDLPDGSRVTLAAESRLRIPVTYRPTAGNRDVHLQGEAFFEVQHDSLRPFLVHTASGVAEDLGTEFVVTAYPETHGMRVVVASGAVALRSADTLHEHPRALLTLTRGDLGWLDSAGTATLTRNVDLARYTSWVDGDLIFDGTDLRDVVPVLARWYDLDIRLADSSVASRRLSATIRNQPAEQVIDLLALSLDLQVQRNGRTVVLSPRSRTPRAP